MAQDGMPQTSNVTSKPSLPRLYSVEEVCTIFSRKPRTIRAWCRSGHLNPVRVGKAVFFRAEDIDAILNGSSSSILDLA